MEKPPANNKLKNILEVVVSCLKIDDIDGINDGSIVVVVVRDDNDDEPSVDSVLLLPNDDNDIVVVVVVVVVANGTFFHTFLASIDFRLI